MRIKSPTASVHAALQKQFQKTQRPFQQILEHYCMERFLYRISETEYADQFVLKGAVLLQILNAALSRPTRDIDFLGYFDHVVSKAEEIVRYLCELSYPPDGVLFDPGSVKGEPIQLDAKYSGVRVFFDAKLHTAQIQMQLDIGFGDVVIPKPQLIQVPTSLGFPSFSLRSYPKEAIVAEKYHAMIFLGLTNSRLKDLYDIYQLALQHDFEGKVLSKSIQATFLRRETNLEQEPLVFTDSYAGNPQKQAQWKAFLRRMMVSRADLALPQVLGFLNQFLMPPTLALIQAEPFWGYWPAGGVWLIKRE